MAAFASCPSTCTLRVHEGLRLSNSEYPRNSISQRLLSAAPSTSALFPRSATIVAQKKALKKRQIILLKDVDKLGKVGDLTNVKPGYFRNYLYPYGFAKLATESILRGIEEEKEKEESAKRKLKSDAMNLAQSLQMAGQFTIRKKKGEGKAIFGSVTTQDVVDAIRLQTLKEVDKRNVTVPDIKELGLFDVEIKLHPEVTTKVKINILPGK